MTRPTRLLLSAIVTIVFAMGFVYISSMQGGAGTASAQQKTKVIIEKQVRGKGGQIKTVGKKVVVDDDNDYKTDGDGDAEAEAIDAN